MFNVGGEDEADDVLPGTYDMYKSVADDLLKKGKYRKAIHSYTNALELREGDQRSLVCRSQCHLKLGETKEALRDAEKSMEEDKSYHRGMFQKAEALFNQGDFEMALVFYHRGHFRRPDLMEFSLGIQKAQEAIVNCVGTPDRVKLDLTGDLSFFKTMYEKKPKKKPSSLHKKAVVVEKRRVERSAQRDRTIRHMLGDLYGDKTYIEKLLKKMETEKVIETGANKKIKVLAEDGLDYLDTRTEFWQQVKPMYARKYEQRQAMRQFRPPKATTHEYILAQIDKLDNLMAEAHFENARKRATFVMGILDGYSETQLANLQSFKAKVHSVHGNAALELGDYTAAARHHQKDRDIGIDHGVADALSRGLDNLGRVYARTGKFRKAIEVWERKLPLCKTPLETTWLCHELGRCYLEVEKADVAKDYGERSLAAAQEAEDDMWQLHALVLISQAEVKYGHLSSSLITFEIAHEIADLLMDRTAQESIKTAINDVNTRIARREVDVTEGRDRETADQSNPHMVKSNASNKSRNSVAHNNSDTEDDREDKESPQSGDDESEESGGSSCCTDLQDVQAMTSNNHGDFLFPHTRHTDLETLVIPAAEEVTHTTLTGDMSPHRVPSYLDER